MPASIKFTSSLVSLLSSSSLSKRLAQEVDNNIIDDNDNDANDKASHQLEHFLLAVAILFLVSGCCLSLCMCFVEHRRQKKRIAIQDHNDKLLSNLTAFRSDDVSIEPSPTGDGYLAQYNNSLLAREGYKDDDDDDDDDSDSLFSDDDDHDAKLPPLSLFT